MAAPLSTADSGRKVVCTTVELSCQTDEVGSISEPVHHYNPGCVVPDEEKGEAAVGTADLVNPDLSSCTTLSPESALVSCERSRQLVAEDVDAGTAGTAGQPG